MYNSTNKALNTVCKIDENQRAIRGIYHPRSEYRRNDSRWHKRSVPCVTDYRGDETYMERKLKTYRLPYIEGGAAGALVAFTVIDAVFSVLATILYLILMFAVPSFIIFVSLASSAIGAVLACKIAQGLYQIHKGNCHFAHSAASAINGRRIMLWVSYAYLLISVLISTSKAPGGTGLLAFVIIALISLAVMIPASKYFYKAKSLLEHIIDEKCNGKTPIPPEAAHFSILSATIAVVIMIIPILYEIGPYLSKSLEHSFLQDFYDSYHGSDWVVQALMDVIMLGAYLGACRILLVNICYRRFVRFHRTADPADEKQFVPDGKENTRGICVLASVFCGWLVLLFLQSYLDYRHIINEYPIVITPEISDQLTNYLINLASYIVLFISFIYRKWRYPAGIIGAAGLIVSRVKIVILWSDKTIQHASYRSVDLNLAMNYLFIVFLALVIVLLALRWAKVKLPPAFMKPLPRSPLILLMLLPVIAEILVFIDTRSSLKYIYEFQYIRKYKDFIFALNLVLRVIDNNIPFLLTSLGLAWMVIPEKTGPVNPVLIPAPDETEKH